MPARGRGRKADFHNSGKTHEYIGSMSKPSNETRVVFTPDLRRRGFFLQRSHIISVGVVEPTFYSNSGVVKYRSAVSGSTVTTVLPLPSFFARRMAAATLVPLEMPHIRPSSRARSLAV